MPWGGQWAVGLPWARQPHGPTRKLPGVLTQGWQGDFGENTSPWLSHIPIHHVLLKW